MVKFRAVCVVSRSLQKQLAYMLARQGVFVELNEDDHGDLVEIINNTDLNTNFLSLAREVRG